MLKSQDAMPVIRLKTDTSKRNMQRLSTILAIQIIKVFAQNG